MRLADFIDLHSSEILKEWEAFAATRLPSAAKMDALALLDHAPEILRAIADDLRQPQTAKASLAKSQGLAAVIENAPQTAAEVHGKLRAQDGFSITQLVSEFRALRAAVIRLWAAVDDSLNTVTALEDMTRFNEALDQAIAESVELFNQKLSQDQVARDAVDRELMLNRGRLEYASRLSNVGFWYCDLPFDVLEWDERVKEHFFIEPTATVTIEDFYDRIHPEDRERTRIAIDTSISNREAYDIIFRTKDPLTGEVKWIRALGGTDYAPGGNPIHFDGITVDVTAQKLADLKVAESEARHRGVITNMDEAFALFDSDFNIIDVNEATCQITGIPRSKLLGSNHWEQFPDTFDSEIGQMYKQVLLDGQSRYLEHRYVFNDDRAFWFEARAFKVGTGVAVLYRDVTKRIEMFEALKDADKRKDEFLAMLAHELRNPLSPIVTAAEILTNLSKTNTQIALPTSVISRQAKHMTRLIDDLLDVARVTQGHIRLQKVAVDVNDVMEQALEICKPLLQVKHQHLSISSDVISPFYVEGDMARLVQCVANIVTNAIKYTDPNGEIKITVGADETDVYIEVADTGSGIAPELLPIIFDLFVQSQRTLDRSQGGLGVGLAIVKRLVEMHGGSVSAFSQGDGLGSTFKMRLPYIIATPADFEQKQTALSTAKRIFLVDDNVDAALSLAMLLEMQGHIIMAVHSARDALDSIESFNADVMLIDIGLPEIDGYELVRLLSKLPLSASLRKIALTGYGQPEDKQRALDVGFDAHLVKPVDMDTLERTIAGNK